jgi:hypothetical protein
MYFLMNIPFEKMFRTKTVMPVMREPEQCSQLRDFICLA